MPSPLFPTGQWVGFYNYYSGSQRFLMDLKLEFSAGRMSGEGYDGVGPFVIAGTYSEVNLECNWDKTYVGRHTVVYRGFREGKGIWGTWTIQSVKGGFHIWPLKEGKAPPLTLDDVEIEDEELAESEKMPVPFSELTP